MRQYHIRRVGPEGIEPVHALLAACGRELARQGFGNWDPPYPRARLAADVVERDVYVVHRSSDEPGELLATFTIATAAVTPYDDTIWREPDAPALYLNRLAVAPVAQGSGVGGWCMREIESMAGRMGCRAVRCDVLSANAGLRAFYERLGYGARGEREHSGWRFTCYELLLPREDPAAEAGAAEAGGRDRPAG